jgi:hypothetical protein
MSMANRKRPTKTMKRYAATRGTRDLIKQAASDLERGLENTDCRVRDKTSQTHCPRPESRKKS